MNQIYFRVSLGISQNPGSYSSLELISVCNLPYSSLLRGPIIAADDGIVSKYLLTEVIDVYPQIKEYR